MDKPENAPAGLNLDLDKLWGLAAIAGAHIHANVKLRKQGLPDQVDREPLQQYAKAMSPQNMLLILHRLRRAGELLDAVKGAVHDLPLRRQIDAYLSGVITQADMAEALPYYAADLAAQAAEAKQAGVAQ